MSPNGLQPLLKNDIYQARATGKGALADVSQTRRENNVD
jgi:hypothetical protein